MAIALKQDRSELIQNTCVRTFFRNLIPGRARDLGIPVSVIVFVAWQPSTVFRKSSNVTISYHDRQD